jgi:hypothetical protein
MEKYAKFSSMGNGSTFSIETIVFAAACASLGSVAFSVYGDDIIIEQALATPLIELLEYLGFIINRDKSYIDGPFRESCGVSCWLGQDITPRYIRELDDRKAVWCHVINSMVSISRPYGKLMDFLADLVDQLDLPLVPYNEDSMSGVWIDPPTAYSRYLIRTSRKGRFAWQPRIACYKAKARRLCNSDSRSLFLWYIYTFGRKSVEVPIESSWYSQSSHKYVRKWVHWNPVAGAPFQLNCWSDYFSPEAKTLG